VSAIGRLLFRYRNALFPCAFALVLLPGPRLFSDPLIALVAGAALAVLGQSLRAVTIGLEYIIRGGRERRVYARDLVTEGLYAHTRNPMYLGNLLILGGVALASNCWACVATAVPLFAFAYACIVAAEEEFLRDEFGEAFEEYCRRVPRWDVRIDGLAQRVKATPFHWRRLLVKEYGTLCALIGGLSLLGLLRMTQDHDLELRHHHLHAALVLALSVAAAMWVFAWWAKKSRLIVAD
jgi:protein-S-isoprenylcysteine O-methyltransferase Ste14